MTGTGSLLDKSSSPVCASECVVGTFKSTKKKKKTERQDKKRETRKREGKARHTAICAEITSVPVVPYTARIQEERGGGNVLEIYSYLPQLADILTTSQDFCNVMTSQL